MIEKILERLADALEANTAAILSRREGTSNEKPAATASAKKGAASKKTPPAAKKGTAAKKKVAAKKKAPARGGRKISKQQVTDLLLSVANDLGRDKAVEILGEYGVNKVSELDAADYKDIFKDLKAALEAGPAEAEDEEETEDDELDLDLEDDEAEEDGDDDDFFDED